MTIEEAIKELIDASHREAKYGDTNNHYYEIMMRIEAFDMAIKVLEERLEIHDTCKKCVEFSNFERQPCEDCISRAEVLEFLKGFEILHNHDELRSNLIYGIMNMPSVTPKGVTITDFADRCRECGKIKRCADCYYNDGEVHAECVICDKAESDKESERE